MPEQAMTIEQYRRRTPTKREVHPNLGRSESGRVMPVDSSPYIVDPRS